MFLPLSVNYRLLLFGQKTTGAVVYHTRSISGSLKASHQIKSEILHSVIQFQTEGAPVEFIGPEYLNYPLGKEIIIFYNKKTPEKFVMFNFAGLVLNNKMIIPAVSLIMWFAFYFSMKEAEDKKTAHKARFRKFLNTVEQNPKRKKKI